MLALCGPSCEASRRRSADARVTFPTDEEWDAQRAGVRIAYAPSIAELNAILVRTDEAFTETTTKATHTELEDAVIGHWARATAVAIGLRMLCENSYGDLAMILNRSLAELLGSVAWLLVEPEKREARARLFTRFVDVELEEQARLAGRIGHPPEVAQLIRDQIAEVDPSEPSLSDVFAKPWLGWTQLEVRDLVPQIAPFWEHSRWLLISRYLKLAQDFGKWQGHATAALTLARVHRVGDDRTISAKGDGPRVPSALHVATKLLTEITGVCGEALGIEEVRDLYPRH
jgi:hypothetical protein